MKWTWLRTTHDGNEESENLLPLPPLSASCCRKNSPFYSHGPSCLDSRDLRLQTESRVVHEHVRPARSTPQKVHLSHYATSVSTASATQPFQSDRHYSSPLQNSLGRLFQVLSIAWHASSRSGLRFTVSKSKVRLSIGTTMITKSSK